MLEVRIDSRSIRNLEELSKFVDSLPTKFKQANSRAGSIASKKLQENIARRGRPGSVIRVTYEIYGEYGLKLKVQPSSGRGGDTGNRGASGRYSMLIASKIFLNSESGKVGRSAFTVPRRSGKSGRGTRMVISHTSGQWVKGRKLMGPLTVPQMGPFYFSSQTGMPRETIQKAGNRILGSYLNRYYRNALKRGKFI
jgi:hypothetical protein